MDSHENLIVYLVTLIFSNFSEDRVCVDSVGKMISLLVIYLPLVAFPCEYRFLTVGFSVDCYAGRICTQNQRNDRLIFVTIERVLGVAFVVRICNNRECAWSCNNWIVQPLTQRVHLELQHLDCSWNCKNRKCTWSCSRGVLQPLWGVATIVILLWSNISTWK